MTTKILPICESSLKLAKSALLRGDTVAFPTETVYGLGANALNESSVEKVFEIKGRPNDNPLIVHVHKDFDLNALVSDIPDYAKKLAKLFLPGPLTMVYNSKNIVCPAVSCGLNTLAVRIPSHEGAQKFLKYVDMPIAAPSANISKHVSPVTAQHVYDDLCGKIQYILDGGRCSGGIESTVLDCTGEFPTILRSGLVTREMIEKSVGRCDEYVLKEGEAARSPGMKYKHYSPKCKTMLFPYAERFSAFEEYKRQEESGVKVYLMSDIDVISQSNCKNVLVLGESEREIAANLYEKLREGELVADLIIGVAPEKQDGIMTGVMNRMSKACRSDK